MPLIRGLSVFAPLKLTAPPLWLAVVLPIAYFTAAVVSVSLFTHNTPLWISNALVVTALLRSRRSAWPALLCLVVLADYAQILVTANGMWVAGLGIVVCDISEILLVATLSGFTEGTSLEDSIWPMARLAAVCLLVPMASAAGGAALLNLAIGVPFGEGWVNWYLAVASGYLMITPLVLCWTDPTLRIAGSRHAVLQTLALSGLVAVVGYLDFRGALPGLFLAFPFLLLTAFHGRLLGATTAAAALALVAIWSTFGGYGPIAAFAGTNVIAKVQYLQLYLAVVLLSALPLAALLGQRETLATQRYREVQAELAHSNRVAGMGQLTASIAHEINQPIAGIVTSGMAALGWLDRETPDLEAAKRSVDRVMRDAKRAGEVIARIRGLIVKAPPRIEKLDINDVIRDVIALTSAEAARRAVSVNTALADGLPSIRGDRVQIQQVILNLFINALEAMSEVRGGVRELLISTSTAETNDVLVTVRDSGPGLAPGAHDQLFEAFYTTKSDGLGLGLSICRSIIEAHGGKLWASANAPRGAEFQFTLRANPHIT